jgi:predicted ester cyclase
MSLEENKAIVRRLTEAFNKKNLALLDELIAPDYFDHTLQLRGLENVKQFMTRLYKGFPDFHWTIEDITAEGDKVWVHVTGTGTHTGEYRGLAPTGKKITVTIVDIRRIVDGKMVELWTVSDLLDFYKQLGVIEYKGFPKDVS